jgi:hypothetical protein
MKLTILIVCTLLLWPSGRALCQANRENSPECALAERALAAYQEIKPGTARKEIEKNFDYDRGIHFRERGRYTYRGCNCIKLGVDFSPAPDIGNTPDPSNDKVMAVSKLFIDYPVKD